MWLSFNPRPHSHSSPPDTTVCLFCVNTSFRRAKIKTFCIFLQVKFSESCNEWCRDGRNNISRQTFIILIWLIFKRFHLTTSFRFHSLVWPENILSPEILYIPYKWYAPQTPLKKSEKSGKNPNKGHPRARTLVEFNEKFPDQFFTIRK